MVGKNSVVVYPDFTRRGRAFDRSSVNVEKTDRHWEVEDLAGLLFSPVTATSEVKPLSQWPRAAHA